MNREKSDLKNPLSYYVLWIGKNYRHYPGLICLLLFLTLLSTLTGVAYPRLIKTIIDRLVTQLDLFEKGGILKTEILAERVNAMILIFLLGGASLVSGFYPYFRGRTNLIFEMDFRNRYFRLLITKSHRFFQRFRTGDLVTRLTDDIKTWPPGISWVACSGVFRAFNSACIVFFCFISMAFLNWKLTLTLILPLPLILFLYLKLEDLIRNRTRNRQNLLSETNDFLESVYSGIRIVKSFNSEMAQNHQFSQLMTKRVNAEVDVSRIQALFSVYFEFMNYIGTVLVLLIGGILVIRKSISIGDFYAFFSYLGMITHPMIDIPNLFVSASQSFVAIDRLDEIENTDQISISDKTLFPSDFEQLSLENIIFRYPDDTSHENSGFLLKNISFSIRKGEKIAIVGKIGSGKTTLMELITGFLKPDSGKIMLNDKICDSGLKGYQKAGYVQQEPNIFSETVMTNIDFWRDIPEEWIIRCAEIARIDSEIREFPGGYQEKIGQRGISISGGQRQRLSIARALAGKPQLLLMDDVTSSLDAENEMSYWQQVLKNFPELTCLIVTHRLSTAAKCDRIIVLSEGEIEAEGTHEELMKISGTYQELISS